jgi:hypothetical protein
MAQTAALLFPADPFSPRKVDAAYAAERDAAQAAGLRWSLLDHDALDRHKDARASLRRTDMDGLEAVVYRGWMVSAHAYSTLCDALAERGVSALSTAPAYRSCHHWPEAYSHVARFAAQTRWVEDEYMDDPVRLQECLAPFANASVVLKDWMNYPFVNDQVSPVSVTVFGRRVGEPLLRT